MTNTKPMKVYQESEEALRQISALRYANKMDKKQLTPARLLKATLKIPNVKDILLKANIKNER